MGTLPLPNGKTVRLQFNVNVNDEKDVEWTPVLLGATPADEAAAAAGTLRAKFPTHSYWQFVVQAYTGDLDDLPDNLWFKIDSAPIVLTQLWLVSSGSEETGSAMAPRILSASLLRNSTR